MNCQANFQDGCKGTAIEQPARMNAASRSSWRMGLDRLAAAASLREIRASSRGTQLRNSMKRFRALLRGRAAHSSWRNDLRACCPVALSCVSTHSGSSCVRWPTTAILKRFILISFSSDPLKVLLGVAAVSNPITSHTLSAF